MLREHSESKAKIITALKRGDTNIFKTISQLPEWPPTVGWLIKYSSEEVDDLITSLSTMLTNLHIPNRIIMQNDSSIYDGLNQALARVNHGSFVVVGAGDIFTSNAIKIIEDTGNVLEHQPDVAFASFAIHHLGLALDVLPKPELLSQGMFCPHPGVICKVSVAKEVGLFDTRYRIAADYDFILKVSKKYPRVITSNEILVNFDGGGLSEMNPDETNHEVSLIRLRQLGL